MMKRLTFARYAVAAFFSLLLVFLSWKMFVPSATTLNAGIGASAPGTMSPRFSPMKSTGVMDGLMAAIESGQIFGAEGFRLVAALRLKDRPSALHLLNGLKKDIEKERLIRELFRFWSADDLPGAADATGAVTEPGLRAAIQHSICQLWCASDPESALAWVLKLPVEQMAVVGGALHPIFEQYANRPLSEQYALAARLPPGAPRKAAGWLMADALMAKNPVTLSNEPIPEDLAMARAMAERFLNSSSISSWLTLEWVERLEDPDLRFAAVANVATTEYHDSPEQSLNWILSLPESQQRAQLVRAHVHGWARKTEDPKEIIQWVEYAPVSGETEEAMLAGLLTGVGVRFPEWSRANLNLLRTPGLRQQILQRIEAAHMPKHQGQPGT